jgi:hypothetical protein
VSRCQCPALTSQRQDSAEDSGRYNASLSNPGPPEERAEDFFGFKEFAGDLAGAAGVPEIIGVDLFYGFGDLA